jgi:hypothetical protein
MSWKEHWALQSGDFPYSLGFAIYLLTMKAVHCDVCDDIEPGVGAADVVSFSIHLFFSSFLISIFQSQENAVILLCSEGHLMSEAPLLDLH